MERAEYKDRVYGCWLGKNIGGTLGVKYEGSKDFLDVPLTEPCEMAANDDLDLQLVWLDMLRRKGIRVSADDFVEGWLKNITYACDEYGVVISNLKAGLRPPVTGYYNNWFHNGMGAPIRSEIWGCIAAGRPEVAGWYAWQDAMLDHWGDGIYGEIFLAALESAAFTVPSLPALIDAALSFIPESSKVYRAVKQTVMLHGAGRTLRETREAILKRYGHHNFTDCVENIAFTIAGLLYGEGDFLKSIVCAVNCGYDTDCTGATAGAVAGILLGRESLVKSGYRVSDEVVAGDGIKDIEVPGTLKELTERVVKLCDKVNGAKGLPGIPHSFVVPALPEFNRPFAFVFEVSEPFGMEGLEEREKVMLNNGYGGYREAVFDSSFFDLNAYFKEEPSAIFLKTAIELPERRKIKVFPASTDGIKLWVDGRQVLSHHEHNEFLPAPHRPGSPLAVAELDKGEHEILLEVLRCDRKLEFGWIIADEKNHLMTNAYSRQAKGGVRKQAGRRKDVECIAM